MPLLKLAQAVGSEFVTFIDDGLTDGPAKGFLAGDDCVCGCDTDAHTQPNGTPGGPCSGCGHCDYYDSGVYMNPNEGTTDGEREYLQNVPRRFW
jgi:hypothetical protein